MVRADEGMPDVAARPAEMRWRSSSRRYRRAMLMVGALAVAAAIGGALAGCHPTDNIVLDRLYPAALAALVTVAASKSSRYQLLWLCVISVGLSRSWLWIPAGAGLALACASVFQRRSHRRLAGLIGALAIQAVLRWPSGGFHGFTAIAAAVAVAPVLYSGWRHCPRRLRRRLLVGGVSAVGVAILFTLPVLFSALFAKGATDQGIALAKSSLNQVEAGQAPAATKNLRKAASDLASARSSLTGWWNLGAFLVPVVAQQERVLYHGTEAGAQLTSTASKVAGALDVQSLRYRGGRIDIKALAALQQPAQTLDSAILSAQNLLGDTPTDWVVPPLSSRLASLSTELGRARSATDLAVLGAQDGPAILGADGVRHYFVAFMTPAETRGLGGFIGAYGVLTVDHGSIHLTASGSTAQLDKPPASGITLIAPPDFVARYGRYAPQDHFQDLTYSPDFPSVEQAIAGLYPQVAGTQIDGAMVLDPYALAALLKVTGPISLPGLGTRLTAANAADVLLRQQYLAGHPGSDSRHDILQSALKLGFIRLTAGSLPAPKALSQVLDPEVEQGRLLFWTNHPKDAALLQRLGLAGDFPQAGPSSDLLAVTLANAGNNKIDAYLHQKVSDLVQYDPATGHVHSTVNIKLQNAAPDGGLPPYVIGSYSGSDLPPGTSYDWLSLYSPLHVVSVTMAGVPVSMSSGVEAGTNVNSTYVEIPAQSTSSLTVILDGTIGAAPSYHMVLRQQPLANPQTFSVTAVPSHGWLYRSGTAGTWEAEGNEIERHVWSFAR